MQTSTATTYVLSINQLQKEHLLIAHYYRSIQCANNLPTIGSVNLYNDVTITFSSNTMKQEKTRSRTTLQETG